jgi:glycosyltransferase involved in cell wall biosynthesis
MHRIRVAILCDFAEDQWRSMDLIADILHRRLSIDFASEFNVTKVRPRFTRLADSLPLLGRMWTTRAVERFINRFVRYPRWLSRHRQEFDVFHIIDHSYSQLTRVVPCGRTLITCHDLDAFRSVLSPSELCRPFVIRLLARNVLNQFRRAARIACVSNATRDLILQHGLISPERLAVVPNGVDPAYCAASNPAADREAARLLGGDGQDQLELLHVGSTIPRKRIDVLLQIFSEVRREFPPLRLVHAGGEFTPFQRRMIAALRLDDSVRVVPFVSADLLAAIYRRAALLLLPSESEGFGLPVIEAMACGTPVIASDLPALREVGGIATTYRHNCDVTAWAEAISELLREKMSRPERWTARCLASRLQAARFDWADSVAKTAEIYREIAQ